MYFGCLWAFKKNLWKGINTKKGKLSLTMFVSKGRGEIYTPTCLHLHTYKMNRLINWPNKKIHRETGLYSEHCYFIVSQLTDHKCRGSLRNGNYSKGVSRAKRLGETAWERLTRQALYLRTQDRSSGMIL